MGMPISGAGGGYSAVMSKPMSAPAPTPAPAAAPAPQTAEVDALATSGVLGTLLNTKA